MLTLLLIGGAAARPTADTILTTLSPAHKKAPWVRFTDPGEPLQGWSKQPASDPSVSVLRVSILSKASLDTVLELFLSQDQQVIGQWNPYTGIVKQLGEQTQLQTYNMPWPFLARE